MAEIITQNVLSLDEVNTLIEQNTQALIMYDTSTGEAKGLDAEILINMDSSISQKADINYVDDRVEDINNRILELSIQLIWQDPVTSFVSSLPTSNVSIGQRYILSTDKKIYTAISNSAFDNGLNPSIGYATMVTSLSYIYSYNGSQWKNTGLNSFPDNVVTQDDIPTIKNGLMKILYPSENGSLVYDDFNTTDVSLNGRVTPTGQTWGCGGPGGSTVSIIDGAIRTTANTYSSLDYGSNIKRISGVFYVGDSGETPAAIIAALNPSLLNMIHMQFTNTGFSLTKRVNGGDFVAMPMTNNPSTKWQLINGKKVRYQITMEINYSTNVVTIITPMGEILNTVADADVTAIAPRYGIFQGDNWVMVEMSERSLLKNMLPMGLTPNIAEISILKGIGSTFKHLPIAFTATSVGWYRVVTAESFIGLNVFGTIQIQAVDGVGYFSVGEFDLYFTSTSIPTLTSGVIQNKYISTGAVTKCRATYSGSTCAFDIYVSSVSSPGCVINIGYSGYGLLNAPVLVTSDLGSSVETIFQTDQIAILPNSTPILSAVNFIPSGTNQIAIKSSKLNPNRMAYHSFTSSGYNATHHFGVNTGSSDIDAVDIVTLDKHGIIVTKGVAETTPPLIMNLADTSTNYSVGLRLSNAGASGQATPALEFKISPFGVCAIQGLSKGGGYKGILKFINSNSAGVMAETARITGDGRLLIGSTTEDTINILQASGSIIATQFRLSSLNTTPSSSTDTGVLGEIRYDSNYMYVCVATNTWKRASITTW